MSSDTISKDVLALLRHHVTTFEQLEILLLLRAHPEEQWTVNAIADRVNISRELASAAAHELKVSLLVEIDPATPEPLVRYAPRSAELQHAVEALSGAFAERRAMVMSIMSTNAIERLRSGAIRAFSDAFVIKRKDHDG